MVTLPNLHRFERKSGDGRFIVVSDIYPANVNNLTIDALDPVPKIPEYKVCAVGLEAND